MMELKGTNKVITAGLKMLKQEYIPTKSILIEHLTIPYSRLLA
jgi:hypothetical protein